MPTTAERRVIADIAALKNACTFDASSSDMWQQTDKNIDSRMPILLFSRTEDRDIHTQTYAFRIAASNGAELLVDQSSPDFLPDAGGVVGNNAIFRSSISESVAIKVCI